MRVSGSAPTVRAAWSPSTTWRIGAPRARQTGQEYVIELDVPAAATSIVFGALMPGDGSAWFDSLLAPDRRQALSRCRGIRPRLRTAALKGFMTSAGSYRTAIDATSAKSGKQSLRLSLTGPATPASAAPAVDIKAVVTEYKDDPRASRVAAAMVIALPVRALARSTGRFRTRASSCRVSRRGRTKSAATRAWRTT